MMLKFFFGGYFEEERPLCHCHFTLVYPYFIVKGKNRSKTNSVEVGTQFRGPFVSLFCTPKSLCNFGCES